jgi:hypothetical protein
MDIELFEHRWGPWNVRSPVRHKSRRYNVAAITCGFNRAACAHDAQLDAGAPLPPPTYIPIPPAILLRVMTLASLLN